MSHSFSRLVSAATIGCVVATCSTLFSEDRLTDPDRIATLVYRLNSPSFTERNRIEQTLRDLGAQALPALREARDSIDLEIRYRVERLISTLEAELVEQSLQRLSQGKLPETPDVLPGWRSYLFRMGPDRESTNFYVEMVRAEPALMRSLDGPRDELRLEFERRCTAVNLQRSQRSGFSVSKATIAALLFVATQPECRPSPFATPSLLAAVRQGEFAELLRNPDCPEPAKRLLAAWVVRSDAAIAIQRLNLAGEFALPEVVEIAREVLHSGVSGSQIQHAILYLAEYGNRDALHELEPFLDDQSRLAGRRNQNGNGFTSRVQDVALIALLALTDQDPSDYGFRDLRENHPSLKYHPNTVGFRSEEEREAALSAWRRWSVKNLKAVQPVPVHAVEGVRL